MTVFRRLTALGYQNSYSHRDKYYTLQDIPEFDEQGLWSYRDVWFSRDGNLLDTSERFVEEAVAGLTVGELEGLLSVEVKEPLLQLYRRQRVDREQMQGRMCTFRDNPAWGGNNACNARVRQRPWKSATRVSRWNCRRNSRPPSFCSTVCWTNSNVACTQV